MKQFGPALLGFSAFLIMNTPANGADQVFSKSIYRLDNQRYERFTSETGSVFLLSTSFSYEDKLKGGICEKATKSMKEVLKIKDDALSDDDKKNESAIKDLIAGCGSRKIDIDAGVKKKDGIEVKLTPTKPDGSTPEPGVSVKKNWP